MRFTVVNNQDLKNEEYRDDCFVLLDHGKAVESDGGEPEDQLLVRDWSWVPEMLNEVDAGRVSLAQEIRETLKVRGHWAPKRPSDLIGALAKALDK